MHRRLVERLPKEDKAMLNVKILALKKPQRYSARRTLMAAWAILQKEHPSLQLQIEELTSSAEILRYTPVTIYPSLVINERLVCVGRFPKKGEVIGWLKEALQEMPIMK